MEQQLQSGARHCRVVAGGTITTYWVTGCGDVVLVLTADEHTRKAVLSQLSSTFRVVAPDLCRPPAGVDPSPWLAAFVEALGIADVLVLADLAYEGAARLLALADPDRVVTVVAIRTEALGGED